jgi:hypothetical protein
MPIYIVPFVKETTEIRLYPDNLNTDTGFTLSWSWNLATKYYKKVEP